MTSPTRRTFVKQSVAMATSLSLATAFAAPPPLLAMVGSTPEPVPPIDDPRLKALTQRALDSARSAGASYTDVRLTHTRNRLYDQSGVWVRDSESITVGVRVLAGGYWGFASGPVWSAEEMTRLGQEAARQAKTNALGKPRTTELAPVPVVRDAHWATPVAIDPFAVHPSQVRDMMAGVNEYAKRRPYGTGANFKAQFVVQDKSFGSSGGSYFTQRTYLSNGVCTVGYKESEQRQGGGAVDFLTPAGVGYELFNETELRNAVDIIMEDVKADLDLPVKPVDVGRYDAVVSASGISGLLNGTIGAATELDRALGYEANAGGTSYLNDPMAMLGQYNIGVPMLSVSGNRNDKDGAATVAWDDEAVVPESFPIVTNGTLVDFQTTREGASWLRDHYNKSGQPMKSHGCAYGPAAVDAPMPHTANLVMASGTDANTFESLCETLDKGLAFKELLVTVDFQQLNGLAFAPSICYEITKGKKTGRLVNAGALFRAPELWKSVRALGGSESVRTYGERSSKGQPAQAGFHSITAVPALLDKLTIIDVKRKA